MSLIIYNLNWMSFNVMLAMIPVFFGWLMIRTHKTTLRVLSGSIWFIFLPNTIYLLTDSIHFFSDWYLVKPAYQGIFLLQYITLMIIGVVTFILGMYPLEVLLRNIKGKKKQRTRDYIIYLVNFLIGFGIVLGRIQRINSWEIVTNLPNVINQTITTLVTPQILLLALWFGLVSNVVYFSFRDFILHHISIAGVQKKK